MGVPQLFNPIRPMIEADERLQLAAPAPQLYEMPVPLPQVPQDELPFPIAGKGGKLMKFGTSKLPDIAAQRRNR